jgi:hypothetical protein
MNGWVWLLVGLGCFLFLSAVFSLVIAAILRQIGHDVSDLLESGPSAAAEVERPEPWAAAPLTREQGSQAEHGVDPARRCT